LSPKKKRKARPRNHRDHYMDNIVAPEVAAANWRDRGVPITAVHVRTNPDATGFSVTCNRCGTVGKMPTDPGNKVAVCPDCLRAVGLL
jgi:hypothetical protein